MRVQGAMRSADGLWLVEAVYDRRSCWYRITRALPETGEEQVIDMLAIATVHRILTEAGVDLAELHEVYPAA